MEQVKPKKTIYFLIDASGSMAERRAGIVNTAMKGVFDNVIPTIVADATCKLDLHISVLIFSDQFPDGVKWVIENVRMEEIVQDDYKWEDIPESEFYGGTPTGQAIYAVINDLKGDARGEADLNTVAPAIILISDGQDNCGEPSYDEVLKYEDKDNLNYCKLFRHSIRVALGIDIDPAGRAQLQKFGKISKSLKGKVEGYYDHSENYEEELIGMIQSLTRMLSEQ